MADEIELQPTPGNIIAEPLGVTVKTASGIVLSVKKVKTQRARVLAVGEYVLPSGEKGTPIFKVGDTIIFKKWDVWETKAFDRPLLFLKFSDILAVEV